MENKNILIAEVCGLCGGCKNAVLTCEKESQKNAKVVLFKEIVHNKNVNKHINSLGIKTIDNIKDAKKGDTVIIRAHGEPPSTFECLKNQNINFVDCTCKNVKNIHDLVEKYSLDNYFIVIIGKTNKENNSYHPEIEGTIGYCKNGYTVVSCTEDVDKINPTSNKIYIVCQTTFGEKKADEIILKIKDRYSSTHTIVTNKSICEGQKQINISSANLAKTCDLMVVVGGQNSSNTAELFKNMSSITTSIFLEDIFDFGQALELNNIKILSSTKIGLTAGASTMKEELFELKKIIEKYLEEQNEF